MGKIILTGDRPTRRLHVGCYVGSLKRRAKLQNSGEFDETYIIIADAQALIDNADNLGRVRQSIIEVTLDYLACGLDLEKSVLSIQPQVPKLCKITFYYVDLVAISRLQRSPTVKSEIQMHNFEASIPVGLFAYPISQVADITAFKATTAPVGEDRVPMIEQIREIVHKSNSVYGEALMKPDVSLSDNKACLHLPGIDDKTEMSKSLGSRTYLSNPEDRIKKKIMSMFTDPNHPKVEDPGQVEGDPVFIYLDTFCRDKHFEKYLPDYKNLDKLKAYYTGGGLGDVEVKRFLNSVLQDELRPIRERRREIARDIPAVYHILGEGSHKAEWRTTQILAEMKRAMKINCFEDKELIAEQVGWFRAEME